MFSISYFLTLDGCPCENFDCADLHAESCRDPAENENYIFCSEMAKSKFDECFEKCGDDRCGDQCAEDFQINLHNCPCGYECLGNEFYTYFKQSFPK